MAPLARLAYNYWWTWAPGGARLFERIDPQRWSRCDENPVRLLQEADPAALASAAADASFLAEMNALVFGLDAHLGGPEARPAGLKPGPIAAMCAEYGIHHSLPIYAGGLGVLMGDFLKEASDQALPYVGVGLLYWQGSFHQQLDPSGWQHEYWLETDAQRLPMAPVCEEGGRRLTVEVPARGQDVIVQVWRVDVGRVPLYLLDTNVAANRPADRWITSRLYTGDRELRLAQYAILGIGGVRVLSALGIHPALIHLNEGHAALACLELARESMAHGVDARSALEEARRSVIFTTHTPVAAGHDTFTVDELRSALGETPAPGLEWSQFVDLGRCRPGDPDEPFGMTPFALRFSRAANGVSRRHGEVAREMWQELWPDRAVADVPISHVTNGVHLSTWMAPEMRDLLDEYLPRGWRTNAGDAAVWQAVDDIPDELLWAVRCKLRKDLVDYVRERSLWDRLGRGEPIGYAESASDIWDSRALTIGFVRRIATYKRLYLLTADPGRALRILDGERKVQVLIAGKAHPQDEDAKRTVQQLFGLDRLQDAGSHVVFLQDLDIGMESRFVRGCDLWLNLPRPPAEASGTSGMKSMLNGGLQFSVLDGWWAEAYDGDNGWAIDTPAGVDNFAQDAHDSDVLFGLMESEVIPAFYSNETAGGVPHAWVRKIKASLKSLAPRFTTRRMIDDYVQRIRDGGG